MTNLTLEFDENNRRQFGPCQCCGNLTERVWGYVRRAGSAVAVYFVEWTPGHIEKSASFDLILGAWGDDTTPADRQVAALEFRKLDSGPAFKVIDAGKRPTLASHALLRDEIIGAPIAQEVFAIADAVYFKDPRLDELKN